MQPYPQLYLVRGRLALFLSSTILNFVMYDLIIIGAGPAGTTAGVYAARKKLKTLLITDAFGGQSVVSETIYNWIGTPEISGEELAQNFRKHLEYYADGETLTLAYPDRVNEIHYDEQTKSFEVKTENGKSYASRALFVGTGSKRRKLPAEGAYRLEHKGLTYCASCDGPLFSGMDVAVIGGGNAAFETAAQLSAYCKSVTILQRSDEYRADKITVDRVLSRENVKGITNAETTKILGENFVEGLVYRDRKTGEEHTLNVKGIFVEIGQIPNSDLVADLVERNEYKQVKVDPWTQQTTHPRIWAAGDVTEVRYHQNNISSGDAVKALEHLYQEMHSEKE